ncbi:hypothetical protein [Mitsuaria sp. BK037]|uniref:hypothetical protein n=1 Tax=Mitsuaria sp. BK037 TaxID=2587122 RepID=UPI00160DAFBF|nr:hypothetical protein [Mitsuaria sp. BK037]MBB3281734.1 hypothetical protein [Mitsuaria sp. BK037]
MQTSRRLRVKNVEVDRFGSDPLHRFSPLYVPFPTGHRRHRRYPPRDDDDVVVVVVVVVRVRDRLERDVLEVHVLRHQSEGALAPVVSFDDVVRVLVDFVQARAFVTTIDRARNLVLIERLPRFGLSAKQQKFVLSDFAAVESHSVAVGRSLVCRVSLVTPGLRSLVLLNGSGGYGAKSFWHAPMPAETEEAASVRVAVAKVSGLADMGYRGTIGLSVVAYEPIDA